MFDAERDAGQKLLTPSARRLAVGWAMRENGGSQRRACTLVGIVPKANRPVSRRADDAEMRGRVRVLASELRRFGYRPCLSCWHGRACC